MPERAASVPYTSFPTVESQGGGGTPSSVRANPNDFGAQVSQQVEKSGDTAFDIAQKQQGMINETQMVNGETALTQKLGALHGQYMSLSGQQAYEQLPNYLAQANAAVADVRGTLRGADAIHGYDMLAERRLGFTTSDWEGYAAGQVKQANETAHLNNLSASQLMAGDPAVAVDDQRFGEQVTGPIKHSAQSMLDESQPGFKTDPETGNVNFDNTPVGQNAKANFENNLNHYLGQAYIKRYDTLSNVLGPVPAYQKFQQDKDSIPPAAIPHIEAQFEPKIFNANVNTVVNTTMGEANQAHQALLINPSNVGSNSNNLGNVKTAEGAKNNTQDFINPATPVDGVILTANNLKTKNYEGKTLEQIGHTWTSTNPDDWVKNVVKVSGLDPKAVPDLNDPVTMNKLLKGISVAEGKDKSIFTDDVISQGVQGALSGKQPQTTNASPYPTNDKGGLLTQADYYQTHRAELIQKAQDWAEQTDPGNLRLRNAAVERVNQQMSAAIEDQNGQLAQDKTIVQRAFNGDLSKGQKPATWDDLNAIPGVKDAIDRVSTHDKSDFIRGLDARLTSRSEGKDEKNFGSDYMNGVKGIHPTDGSAPTITNDNQLYNMYYQGKITDAGREKLSKLLNDKTPEGSVEGKQYQAVLEAGKSILNDDKQTWPSGLVAITKLDDELKTKGIPASERYASIENKNSVLHALDPIISAQNTPQAIADNLAKVESDKPSALSFVVKGPYALAKRNLISDFQSGKYTNDKVAGEQALREGYKNGVLDDQTAKDMAVAYGYAIATKATQ